MTFATLHKTYADFFEKTREIKPKSSHVFFMAIDAEWYANGEKNIVLSYQIATSAVNKTDNIILYMQPGQRLTLAEIVERGVNSVVSDGTLDSRGGGGHRNFNQPQCNRRMERVS